MILEFQGKTPKIDPTAFVAENAMVIGDVEIGPGANIWFQSVVRGDTNSVIIGPNCNVQDACVLHVVKDRYPVILEEGVVLGHPNRLVYLYVRLKVCVELPGTRDGLK